MDFDIGTSTAPTATQRPMDQQIQLIFRSGRELTLNTNDANSAVAQIQSALAMAGSHPGAATFATLSGASICVSELIFFSACAPAKTTKRQGA